MKDKENKSQIIIYQTEGGQTKVSVQLTMKGLNRVGKRPDILRTYGLTCADCP